jgi:hypothetical protein
VRCDAYDVRTASRSVIPGEDLGIHGRLEALARAVLERDTLDEAEAYAIAGIAPSATAVPARPSGLNPHVADAHRRRGTRAPRRLGPRSRGHDGRHAGQIVPTPDGSMAGASEAS